MRVEMVKLNRIKIAESEEAQQKLASEGYVVAGSNHPDGQAAAPTPDQDGENPDGQAAAPTPDQDGEDPDGQAAAPTPDQDGEDPDGQAAATTPDQDEEHNGEQPAKHTDAEKPQKKRGASKK